MNPLDILKGLNTPKDWATFVLGFVVGTGVTAAGVVGLKNVFNLDLVAKGSYYTQEQVNGSYVSNQTVARLFTSNQEVAKNYLALSFVQANYIPRNACAQNAEPNPVDMNKYILRTDLANYISRADVQRYYLPTATCEKQVRDGKRINVTHAMKHRDVVDLPVAGIRLEADIGLVSCLEVSHAGASTSKNYCEPHFEKYEYNGHRIALTIQSVSKDAIHVSLIEDQ